MVPRLPPTQSQSDVIMTSVPTSHPPDKEEGIFSINLRTKTNKMWCLKKYKQYLPSRNNQGLQRPGPEDKHSIINVLFVLNRNKKCFQQDLLILALLIQPVIMILLSWTIFGVWGLHRCKNLLCFFFALLAHQRVCFFLFNGLLALFCFLCFTSSVSFTAYHPNDEDLCNLVPGVSLLPFLSLAMRERKKRDPGNEVEIFAESNPYLLSWKEHLVCPHKTVLSETTNRKKIG